MPLVRPVVSKVPWRTYTLVSPHKQISRIYYFRLQLFVGIIVLLALAFLSPYFNYIPEATLAAILICSIFTLLDFKLPMRLWRESKRDFGMWIVCFIVCILCGVEVGLFVSIIINVAHLLFLWARPEISVKIQEVRINVASCSISLQLLFVVCRWMTCNIFA